MQGVYGLCLRLDGTPEELDALTEQLTLLPDEGLMIEAVDCFFDCEPKQRKPFGAIDRRKGASKPV